MPALLMLALLLPFQTQPPEKCSLTGTVVDSVTGEPLNKVDLRLEPLDRKTLHNAVTRTDAKGRFSLVELDASAYHLVANRSGYFEMAYGARRANDDGSVLRLEPGQALTGINFKLTPGAVIAGMVRDSDGEPLENAHVMLVRVVSEYGRKRQQSMDSTDTDDRGVYRFRSLTAGTYYVGVEPQTSGWDRVDHSASGPREAAVPTFYPGARDFAGAAPIEVAAGKRVEGVDVTLLRSRVFGVRGRVLNPPAGVRVAVSLIDSRNAGMRDYAIRTAVKDAAGNFEFRNVPPGAYDLVARPEGLEGRLPVTVGDADLDDLKVQLLPGAEVRMRVDAPEDWAAKVAQVEFYLTHDNRNHFGPGPFDKDRLVAHNVPPDQYELEVGGIPAGLYMKGAMSGQADVLADGLTVGGPGNIEIRLTLAADGAALSGTVDVPGATVLLVPEKRSRKDLYRTVTADQNGHYEFATVAPGEYKLYGYDEMEPNLEDAKLGEKVTLEAKGKATKDLHLN